MGKKIFWGTLIGGVIAWIWLAISWTVLPWHCSVMQSFDDETDVASVIVDNTPHNGLYVLPKFCKDNHPSLDGEEFDKGPVMFAAIQPFGAKFPSFVPYLISFLLQWFGAFLIFLVLLQARRLHYGSKVAMATLIGIIIGFLGHFPAWVWWGFPFPFVFVELCDSAIAWFAAGLFMAAFAKGKKPPVQPIEVQKTKEEKRPFWELP